MTATCPSCGQSLPEEDLDDRANDELDDGGYDDGTYLVGLVDEGAEAPAPPSEPAGTGARVMAIVAGLAAVWLIAAMLFSSVFSGSDDETTAQTEAEATTTPTDADAVDDGAEPDPADASAIDDTASNDAAADDAAPQGDADEDGTVTISPGPSENPEHGRPTLVGTARGRRPDTRIAYIAAEGLVIADFEGGQVSASQIDMQLTRTTDDSIEQVDTTRARFLSTPMGLIPFSWTYSVDALPASYDDGPERLLVAQHVGSFTRMARPGDFVRVTGPPDVNEQLPYRLSVQQWPDPSLTELQADERPLLVDGLGALIVGDTGTMLATASGLQPFSEHPVLAATATALIEERCVTTFDCGRYLSFNEGGAPDIRLPDTIANTADRYSISPDASMVLVIGEDSGADIWFVDGQAIAWVTGNGSGMETAHWAEDSSYVTWLSSSDTRSPRLHMFFHETRDWITLDLTELTVDMPVTSELLIID